MRRLAKLRIFGITIAILGVFLAIYWGRVSAQMHADFEQWTTDRPMESAIDLSQPGSITVPFHQTCHAAHAEVICLEIDGDEQIENPHEFFQELKGELIVTDGDGEEVERVAIDNESTRIWQDELIIARIYPFAKGQYIAKVNIDHGVTALSGRQQSIFAKYELCGLEAMPASIMGGAAMFAGFLGGIAAFCVAPGLVKNGIWQAGS